MPRFCVNTTTDAHGDHEVHDLSAGCPRLPSPAHQHDLGVHSDCHGAVRAAKAIYRTADGCAWCARACHTS
jgi:hypothetical protein